ncbi:MAG: hypothetical protein GC168_20470 [Candidatus Hydrogenedens sp.]|nr:hypothetical protein [Candidatus Hydrogenedens sp.]
MSARVCPACGAPAKSGQLLCRACWGMVPAGLRAAVNRTWRAWQASGDARDRPHLLAMVRAYRAAADAATDAARKALPGGAAP